MSSSLVLTVKHSETQAILRQLFQLNTNKDRDLALALSRHFKNMASKRFRGTINVQTSSSAPVAASGTVTLVSAVATNSVTIGKVVFTFTSTPSVSTDTAQDVEVDGASDTLDAAALAAAINANAASSAIVYATSAIGVVTVACRTPGVIGNMINLSKSGAPISVSATYLASGTGGCTDSTLFNYSLGL
jgi:phage tail sheath gpL-like